MARVAALRLSKTPQLDTSEQADGPQLAVGWARRWLAEDDGRRAADVVPGSKAHVRPRGGSRYRRCHRFRAIRYQQVLPRNSPHALMRFRRGDHGACHGHRLKYLVLDAARDAQRCHRHRRMGQIGPRIRHAAGDVHARQFGQGPHGRRWIDANNVEMRRRREQP